MQGEFLEYIHAIITEGNILIAWGVLALAFAVLAKCADIFVESAVVIADRFHIPKLIIGLVLVSLATSTPEITVSLIAALRGRPEMALGNAVGSVICNEGIALALTGILSVTVISIQPVVLKTSAIFLLTTQLLTFLFVLHNLTLDRWQGIVLVAILFIYIGTLFYQHKKGKLRSDLELLEIGEEIEKEKSKKFRVLVILFLLGLGGIIFSSDLIVTSSVTIAYWMGIPEAVVALTIVALGTSLPEIATSVVAAKKNEGEIAVGNILGSDILNICCVAGISSVVNPLTIGRREVLFMFPSMLIIVGSMLLMLRSGYRLSRKKGVFLLSLYLLYILSFLLVFPQS